MIRLAQATLIASTLGLSWLGMRAVHVPHSNIPAVQIGHTEGDPDGVVQRLADVPAVLRQITGRIRPT